MSARPLLSANRTFRIKATLAKSTACGILTHINFDSGAVYIDVDAYECYAGALEQAD